MKGGKTPRGYTIVEVMIVLAISGVMFVIAASFISGKQEKAAFSSGVNQLASNLQDTIEQVNDGQYSDIPFDCTNSGGSLSITAPIGDGSTQGTNSGCTFIGKFVYFSGDSSGTSYDVFSLAAARGATNLDSAEVTTIDNAGINLTDTETTPESLTVQDIAVTDAATGATSTTSTYGGFGFVQGLGTASGNGYLSGDQTTSMVYATGLSNGLTSLTDAQMATLTPARAAKFCVTDGKQYATISLGDSASNGNQLSVNVQAGLTTC